MAYGKSSLQILYFNPDHDFYLASSVTTATAPKAALQLQRGCSYLPVLWGDVGDVLLVEDEDVAKTALVQLDKMNYLLGKPFFNPTICTLSMLSKYMNEKLKVNNNQYFKFLLWGWNDTLKHKFAKHGVEERFMPSNDRLQKIRVMSHRRWATHYLMPSLIACSSCCVGKRVEVSCLKDVEKWLQRWRSIILKEPWSGSGRGVRFADDQFDPSTWGWTKNVIDKQGSIIIEPRYKRLVDFAQLYRVDSRDGVKDVQWCGVSLFQTENQKYTGNTLQANEDIENYITSYISRDLYDIVKAKLTFLIRKLIAPHYTGFLGVDMMIVDAQKPDGTSYCALHPCVELNLRCTMGHVAAALTTHLHPITGTMKLEKDVVNDIVRLRINDEVL